MNGAEPIQRRLNAGCNPVSPQRNQQITSRANLRTSPSANESHVSGVYDSSSNLMKVYINSREVCSTTSTIGAPADLAGSSEKSI